MFYPELSPAMRWHLDHNQKMYNMQMFSHQFSDKFSDQYGKCSLLNLGGRGGGTPTSSKLIVVFLSRVESRECVILLMTWLLVFKRVITAVTE